MIGEAPSYVESEYFEAEPAWHLKENAPASLKKEFEADMNDEQMQEQLKEEYPELEKPFYTWRGKVIDKGKHSDAVESFKKRRQKRLNQNSK